MVWNNYPKNITPEEHVEYCPIIADAEETMVMTSIEHESELNKLFGCYVLQGVFHVYLDMYERDIFEEKSLLLPYLRYNENVLNTYWAIVDLTCGAYFNAIQMLRLIFENALQTLYVMTLSSKYDTQLEIIEEGFKVETVRANHKEVRIVKGFGFIIIDEVSKKYAWFNRKREKAKEIYGKLSAKTHASIFRLKRLRDKNIKQAREAFFFSYDREEFNSTLKLFEEVLEFNLAFLAQMFPEAFKNFIKEMDSNGRSILPLNLANEALKTIF